MILLKPYSLVEEQKDMLRHIEWAGRTCYQSDISRITDESARKFTDMLIDKKHFSVLEHGTVYLKVPTDYVSDRNWCKSRIVGDHLYGDWRGYSYITTNYRDILEKHLEKVLKWQCEPTEYHDRRISVKFVTSRAIAQEFTRHRMFSYSMESTRYCNYSKDRFLNDVSFIRPYWCNAEPGIYKDILDVVRRSDDKRTQTLLKSCLESGEYYLDLIKEGCKPQEAREVLHLSCKTELVMTGFISDWKHFFEMRCSEPALYGKPHPDASHLADEVKNEFIARKYLQ